MKKIEFIIWVFFSLTIQNCCMGQKIEQQVLELRDSYRNFNYVPDSGYINNKEIAIRISKIILESIYGESIRNMTFEAHLIENQTIWVVFGIRPKGMKGGNPYIEINKRDGQILKVAHSK